MEMAMKKDLGPARSHADGRFLCFSLLPLFLVAEGVHRVSAGLKQDVTPSMRRPWFDEAWSQASIATSYALLARSMLH